MRRPSSNVDKLLDIMDYGAVALERRTRNPLNSNPIVQGCTASVVPLSSIPMVANVINV